MAPVWNGWTTLIENIINIETIKFFCPLGFTVFPVKPRPNDRNMPTQHVATLLGATCCNIVAICCVGMLRSFGRGLKPWTPEKISGMLIVSRPIRCEMKPQKITDKPQNRLITTWHETASSLFLPRGIFNFAVFKYWNFSFSVSALVSPKNRYERHFTEKRS